MFKCINCPWEGTVLSKFPKDRLDDKCPVCGDEVTSDVKVSPIKKEPINRTPLSKIKSRLASIKEDLEDDGKLNYSNDSTKKKPGRKLKKSKR